MLTHHQEPARIALIIDTLGKGGAARVLANLSTIFSKYYIVDILVFDGTVTAYAYDGRLIDLNCPQTNQYTCFKAINTLWRAWHLHQHLKKQTYEKIYCFNEKANLPTLLATSEATVCVRYHPQFLRAGSRLVMRLLYQRAKHIIAVSAGIEKVLRENFSLKKVTFIPNPLDFEQIDALRYLPVDYPKPYLLALGQLIPQKGFDLLISAYAQSRAAKVLDLLIIGEGSERQRLQQQIDNLDLSQRVHLKGTANNPYAYYQQAQMFIAASRHEGYPNTLLEALACECPVIATNCPTGPREILINGTNGILVDNENIGQLANAIDYLMENPALRKKFQQNARLTVEHLPVSIIAQQWLKL